MPAPRLDSVYAVPYSSGTTGVPKGVQVSCDWWRAGHVTSSSPLIGQLSHGNLTAQIQQMMHPSFEVISEVSTSHHTTDLTYSVSTVEFSI